MELRRRLLRALTALALLVVVATVGFHALGRGVTWLDAIYMVVISLTGVGYTEIVDTSHSPALRAFNIVVLKEHVAGGRVVKDFARREPLD